MKPGHFSFNGFTGELEEVSCPTCSNPPAPILLYRTSQGVGFWLCPGCDIQYASPRFTEESLLNIYENESFADLSFYDDWTYDKWKNENRHRSYITQRLKLQVILEYISSNDRILDVGCGPGLFCVEARKQGLNAEGIEPSKMLVNIGRKTLNIPMHHGMLESFDPGYKYRIIVLWDVLEHVFDPCALLGKCRQLLDPEGYLFMQVPNYDGLSNRFKTFLCRKKIKKNEFKHFGFPWHVYSFNRNSLNELLKGTGFMPLLFESWSHKLKEGADDIFSRMIISFSKRFHISDYITCLARKE